MRLFLVVAGARLPGRPSRVSAARSSSRSSGSLLTAVPLTPAGIGVVETGVDRRADIVYGVPQTEALAIVLVDRFISVFSVIGFGSIAYWRSPLRKGAGSSRRRCPRRAGARRRLIQSPADPDPEAAAVRSSLEPSTPPKRRRSSLRAPDPAEADRSLDSAPRSCATPADRGPARRPEPSGPSGRIPKG